MGGAGGGLWVHEKRKSIILDDLIIQRGKSTASTARFGGRSGVINEKHCERDLRGRRDSMSRATHESQWFGRTDRWLAGRQEAVTVIHEGSLLLDPCRSTSRHLKQTRELNALATRPKFRGRNTEPSYYDPTNTPTRLASCINLHCRQSRGTVL